MFYFPSEDESNSDEQLVFRTHHAPFMFSVNISNFINPTKSFLFLRNSEPDIKM